jgi:hypothetical protein
LGRYTTIEEIDAVVDRLTDVLAVESNRGPIGKGGLRRPKQPFG